VSQWSFERRKGERKKEGMAAAAMTDRLALSAELVDVDIGGVDFFPPGVKEAVGWRSFGQM
jgi:hypothetical protein